MGLYRKKPVLIEAVQLRWDTWNEMCDFAEVGRLTDGKPEGGWADPAAASETFGDTQMTAEHVLALAVPTLEGLHIGLENDWIIRGVQGELYPCKPDIFAATYEPASATDDLGSSPSTAPGSPGATQEPGA